MCCFFSAQLIAQAKQQYLFTNITAKEGLASNHVSGIVQDEQGYIWIGTLNGLQRYDGNRYLTFRHNPADTSSIPDNNISFIHFDKKHNLWVNFSNGKLGKFDTRKFIFKETNIRLPDDNILTAERQLLEDENGRLLFLFPYFTLTTYNEAKNEFSAAHNFIAAPPRWKITSITYDARSKLYWMGCDSGLAAFNSVNKNLSYKGHNTEKLAAIDSLGNQKGAFGILVDSRQRLWFGAWPNGQGSQVFCFDNRNRKVILRHQSLTGVFTYYHEPRYFLETNGGTIWLYGTGMLAQYDEAGQNFTNATADKGFQKILYNNRIDRFFEDREKTLWICTHNNGIYQFNPSAQLFKSFPHISLLNGMEGNSGALSFVEEKDGGFLYSAWGEGLFRCDTNYKHIRLEIKGLPEKNNITAWDICKRKNGTVWMGLQDGQLIVYNTALRSAKIYTPPIIEKRTIRQIVEDHEENMWIGTQSRGVFKWTPDKGKPRLEDGFTPLTAIPQTLIEKLFVDKDGYLWVCTMVYGVYKINPVNGSIIEHYTNKGNKGKTLFDKGVGDAFQYDDTTMIFAAGGLNILNTKTKTFTYITPNDGLPSGIINAIEKDHNGDLWVSFMMGICRLNLAQKTFSYYDRSDGIANDVFTLAASLKLSNGNLLFGTSTDFTVFHPDDFTIKTVPPDVQVTGFAVNNNNLQTDSLLKQDVIDLSYNESSIIIYFSALSYLQKNKLTYYYKLDGVDKDWIKSSDNLLAVYSHLAPGDYTFQVKCQNADGSTSKNITRLHLAVSIPFWKAWWFYSLIILGAAALIYWYDRERVNRKAALQKMRSEIAGNLHHEMSTALSNINILSEMARLKADRDPQKSKEYIEQIHSKSNNIIVVMDDMLWSLSPDNDSMIKTVDRMREYIDELNNKHDVAITMLVDKKVESLELNMRLRHESFLLFKEGIKSLVQAGMDKCEIQMRLEKNNLLFTIQFRNACCDMQQVYNLLHRIDMEKHLESIHATIDVEVHKTYSILVLHVPVG